MEHYVSQLRVAVLGATGGTGRHVVAAGLKRGHTMVALTRRVGSFPRREGLREAVWPHVGSATGLREALRDVDVVISALGGADRGPTSVCTDAMNSAIPELANARVNRLIAVSAHGALETHDRSLYSMAVWAGAGKKMRDKEAMESLITQSALEWTIVRPPALTNAPSGGHYEVGEDLPIRLWHSIARRDLAKFLILESEAPRFARRHVRIHR